MSKPSRLPTRTPAGPLAGAILGRLRERGMTPAHLAEEMRRLHPAGHGCAPPASGGGSPALRSAALGLPAEQAPLASPITAASARSQVSRLLSGATAHPNLDTYLLLCRALRTDPTELARRAGLWEPLEP